MNYIKWADSRVKNLKWYDMSLVKLSVIAITLMLVKFWPPLASLSWYWYAILFVLLAIKPICALFKK